ncbi:Rust resistance kinase Lr10 [Vitis vinifera]|uniref:non-specific serine/threonine protein kinase n=1 Tax=Vitis vinifera TaxID=29760 RepID=A0A438FCM6_VITVI|nr:Rust resistance kinase Lr10 [Vitis vinifera]
MPCRPSSCGHIRNISNPFRLKGDPSRCGDPDPAYELVCENNRTILYGKYYVTEINYDNYTIRVVVPGLEKGKCFSTPPYSLTLYDVDQFRPDGHNAIVLMNCTRPVISDRNYIRITPCNTSTNGSSFSSQSYAYALVGDSKQVRDLPYSCTFGITVITDKFQAGSESPISSMSDLQEMLLMGIELSFRRIIWHIDGLQCNLNYRDKTVCDIETPLYAGVIFLGLKKYIEGDLGYFDSRTTVIAWILQKSGKLQSGRVVAVKVLIMSKSNGQDFINEVATIGRIHHVNVVRLVGFCVEGSKWALIYDFMPNGSLDKFIFIEREKGIPLSWDRLYRIALGVGRGIKYLHEGCDMQILHFDIKPHNILLDEDFTPKVSDFGLAKLYSIDESIVSLTAARGTFGMLLMEIVGKRRHVSVHEENLSEIYFPSWIYDKIKQGEAIEIGDAKEEDMKYILKMIMVALWCVQMKPMDRPSMSKALEMLEGDVELLQMPPKPTLYSHEMSAEDRENNPVDVPTSTSNSNISISLDGR